MGARAEQLERAPARAPPDPARGARARCGTSAGCCNPDRVGTPYLYGILIAAELFNLMQALGFWWTVSNERVREKRAPTQRVAVDVFIPVYKEPPDIVDLTVAAAVGLRGAEVRVHVLDDGNDDAMRDLAARYGVGYIRRAEHTGAKAGNINHALTKTRRRVHRRVRLRPRGGPGLPRGDARVDGGPQDRVRPDAAVLRQHGAQSHRGGVLGPAGAVLRSDLLAARTGSTRSSAAAPTCCSAARRSRAWAGSRRTR